MRNSVLLVLAFVCHAQSEPSFANDVELLKDKVQSYDEFLFRRYLKTEELTCDMIGGVINSLTQNFHIELEKTLTEARKQLEMVQGLMMQTHTRRCVNGLRDTLDTSVAEEAAKFSECAAAAMTHQTLLKASLAKDITAYQEYLNRTLNNLDVCEEQFANKKFEMVRKECANRSSSMFFDMKRNIAAVQFNKANCMTQFREDVLSCVRSGVEAFADKMDFFRRLLHNCAQPDIADEIASSVKVYNPIISYQVYDAQRKYRDLNEDIEKIMIHYYQLEVSAKEDCMLKTISQEFFDSAIQNELAPHYRAINVTLEDNRDPRDRECILTAKHSMDDLVVEEAAKYTDCRQKVVDDLNAQMQQIRSIFSRVTNELPEVGNVAILQCLQEQFILSPNSIAECYDLKLRGFRIRWSSSLAEVRDVMEGLSRAFRDSRLAASCGAMSLEEILLSGDEALYSLKRCMYNSSGTDYDVTLPPATTVYYIDTNYT